MKIRYYFMSMALMAVASVSFTACVDDDPVDEPVYVIGGDKSDSDIKLSADTIRVKIGEANRAAIPVESSTGTVQAFSLNPDVAEVVMVDGVPMVEGFKNGLAGVMVSDADNNYKKLTVSVYTTDVMEVSHTSFTFTTPLGGSSTNNEASVTLGNGGYTISSDNAAVRATIDEETGAIAITATSRVDPFTAILTVKDASGLSATIAVTVEATFDPFTPEQIQNILALDESAVWGDCKDPSDGNTPYYYGWRDWGYGAWVNTTEDGKQFLGWWCESYGSDLGGLKIEYPVGTAVNKEVSGKLYFQYSNIAWYSCYTYDGTVTLLEDNETRTVVIFNQVDTQNQRLNRGYVVLYK